MPSFDVVSEIDQQEIRNAVDQASREVNKVVKELGLKGVQSQTQGEQVRVTGKKRDDLQAVMAAIKAADLGVPIQFNNFRD